jgi:hypothetical protein
LIPQHVDGSGTHEWTDVPVPSTFLAPYNEKYTPYSQNILGGINLGDGSRGRMFKLWNVSYVDNVIRLKPADGDIVWTRSENDVRSVSCAFDNNMSQVIAWKKDDGCYMYYRDTLTQNFITRSFPGATACRVCVDDSRDFYNQNSDVMFVYTLNNRVYYRRQRDRYDIEYFVGNSKRQLQRVGPSQGLRLQIELI